MIAHCRMIDNRGGIRDGVIEMDVKSTWFGWHAVPPQKVNEFEFDHFTERGVAVYLEETR